MGIFDNLKVLFGAPSDKDRTTASLGNQTQNGKKVLIVEDETVLADALEAKLQHAGYIVAKAGNGKEGLETTQAFKPDIILLDLLMPVMDGKTMLHQLRKIEEFKFLPVVVLTNAGDADNIRETEMFGNASAFLIKSNSSTDEVLNIVDDLTSGKKM
jgi:CheY-like chemotaxis protein